MSVALERPTRAHRSDGRVLVFTGALVGAGSALILPIVWVVAWGAVSGLDGGGIAEWILISLVYAVPAAVAFALLGAVAGFISASLWRQRHRWGRSRSQVLAASAAAAAAAAVVAISAGMAVGLLTGTALFGVVIGLIAASGAGLTAGLSLRRLARREARSVW